MKKRFIPVFLILFIIFLSLSTQAQIVERIRIPELERILKNPENKLFVVNFWASWCQPCVKELPYFEKVSKEYDTDKVQFILISLDFPSQIDKQLIPFLKKNKITHNVPVMMETDFNSWVDKVDPSWQGNIPVTLIFNNSKKQRVFFPGELDEPGLRKMINSFL